MFFWVKYIFFLVKNAFLVTTFFFAEMYFLVKTYYLAKTYFWKKKLGKKIFLLKRILFAQKKHIFGENKFLVKTCDYWFMGIICFLVTNCFLEKCFFGENRCFCDKIGKKKFCYLFLVGKTFFLLKPIFNETIFFLWKRVTWWIIYFLTFLLPHADSLGA